MKKILTSLATFLCLLGLADISLAEGKDYHDQDLKNKDFSNGSLNGADFTDAVLDHAVFINASLKKAIFKGANLNFTSFYKADLSGADLRGVTGSPRFSTTNLTGANLEGLTLHPDTDCVFRGANLKKCKITVGFSNCDFSNADLRGANLRASPFPASTRFKGAIYDDDTAWPDGFDPKAAGAVLKNEEKAADKPADKTDDK